MRQFVICFHGDVISLYLTSDVIFHQADQFLRFSEYILVATDRNLETVAEAHARNVEANLSGSSDIGIGLNRLDLVSLRIIIEKWFDRARSIRKRCRELFRNCTDSGFGHDSWEEYVAPKCEGVHTINVTKGALQDNRSFLDDWIG